MSTETPSNARIEKEHIVMTPGVCGGKPRIAGTRIRVQDVAILHERMGKSPDEIVRSYPHLTLADVFAALAYYFDHIAEIKAQIKAGEELAEEYFREHGPGPLAEILRKKGMIDAQVPPG
jgi:uncharacterized protein (DUF433 family)